MPSLSPIIVSAVDWQFEEQLIHEFSFDDLLLSSYNPDETEASRNSSTSSSQLPDNDYDDVRCLSTEIKGRPCYASKPSHNEYERDRRKKQNKLYSSLRELLPENDQKKKLSIPCTVARVLKYIPELQRQIERLIQKKEELLLRVSKDEFSSSYNNSKDNPVISATHLNRTEIMIQICIFNTGAMITFSKIARILECEGLQIMNATTQVTHADKTFYSLHLQAKEGIRMEGQIICEQLMCSLGQQKVCKKNQR